MSGPGRTLHPPGSCPALRGPAHQPADGVMRINPGKEPLVPCNGPRWLALLAALACVPSPVTAQPVKLGTVRTTFLLDSARPSVLVPTPCLPAPPVNRSVPL